MRILLYTPLCLVLFTGCTTVELPYTLEFQQVAHIVKTERGRLTLFNSGGTFDCNAYRGVVEGAMEDELQGIVYTTDRDMCEFYNGFEVNDWPEGDYAVAFFGYDDRPEKPTLFYCIENTSADRLVITPAATVNFDRNKVVCASSATPQEELEDRCSNTCE